MKNKKLYKKIDKALKIAYLRGLEDGYESCMDSNGVDKAYDNGNDNGIEPGKKLERQHVIELMESYLGLVKFSEEVEHAPANIEWDNGYSAAIAIVKGND